MALLRRLFIALTFLATTQSVWAAPDSTMSITPAATSGTTITAADENDRNNDIVTAYNSHDHTDISQTANTLNIGDGTAGDKTITANAADSPDRSIKWDDTDDQWEAQQNSTTFQAFVVSSGTVSLTDNGLVVGEGDLSVDTIAVGTSGQVLISGGAGSDPAFGSAGGTPALTLSTSNSAGSALTYIRTDDTLLVYDATVPADPGAPAAGSAATAARRDHVHSPSASQLTTQPRIDTACDTSFAGNAMTLNNAGSGDTTIMKIYRPTGADTLDAWVLADTVNAGGNAQYAISFDDGSTCYPDCSSGTQATDDTWTQIATAQDVSGESAGWLSIYVFCQNDSGSDNIQLEAFVAGFR